MLMSLEAFNQRSLQNYLQIITYPIKNGIKCPECGLELYDTYKGILCSNPPKRNIHCDCGYKGYRYL